MLRIYILSSRDLSVTLESAEVLPDLHLPHFSLVKRDQAWSFCEAFLSNSLGTASVYRVLKRGVLKGRGCSWGTLRIPREDWGSLGNITED